MMRYFWIGLALSLALGIGLLFVEPGPEIDHDPRGDYYDR